MLKQHLLDIAWFKVFLFGSSHFYVKIQMHRIKCRECHAFLTEELDFLSSQKIHYTKRLEQTIIELRSKMTIQALAEYFILHWSTVKEIEKRYLYKKDSKINLKNVSFIGIDEIYMGQNGFLTIVRDLETESVLQIGEGKGSDALSSFTVKLKTSRTNIKAVSLDFGRPYSKWAKKSVQNAVII